MVDDKDKGTYKYRKRLLEMKIISGNTGHLAV